MTKQLKEIEIPLGAKDSELCGWEYTIPEGMEATIVDNRIVVKKKEREDERVRKAIRTIILSSDTKQCQIVGVSQSDMFAWLEKQGEHANFLNKIQIGDKVTRNKDGMLVNLSQLNRVAKKDENQGEQKPADKVEPKFKVKYAGSEYNVLEIKDIAGITFYRIEDEPNHIDYVRPDHCEIISGGYGIKENGSPYPTKPAVFSEQKFAWSEEDKLIIDKILCICNDFERSFENSPSSRKVIKEDIDKIDNWLKSLNERVQPKQEWSEEDEKLYNDLSDTYFYNDEDCPEETYKQMLKRVLDWMNKRAKSLRPQSHWKPSEEQMYILNWVANILLNHNGVVEEEASKKLQSLYNDLKKLREK